MLPFTTVVFGNPSGLHAAARAAKTAVEEAREEIAAGLGARPSEIVFTGGGTEADNLAIIGASHAIGRSGTPGHVVTTAFEHKGVLGPCERLANGGVPVLKVAVTPSGHLDLGALQAALDERTILVSVMLVNNEVGTIQPLDDVAAVMHASAPGAVLHTDAVQAVSWLDVATATRNAQLVSVSAHKFGGPKGVGALVVREGVSLDPLILGGGQERGMRSGTINVAGVVAMATALRVTIERRDREIVRIGALRDRLLGELQRLIPDCVVNGSLENRVAGNIALRIADVEAETLLVALDQRGICAAAGSSCASGATEPSHVLAAMGLSRTDALSSIRLTLGATSTPHDVEMAIAIIPQVVETLRGRSVEASSSAS